MRRISTLAALLVMVGMLHAGAQQGPPAGATIEGITVDKATARPIEGVRLVADEDVDAGTLVLEPGFDVVGRIVSTNPLPVGFDVRRLQVLLRVVEGPLLITLRQLL
jgi:hypothetical protein